MVPYFVKDSRDGFTAKVWRGERTFLLGFDVKKPEPDFVGFAVEYQAPKATKFAVLGNRMAFEYKKKVDEAVTGGETYDSIAAPLQTFRWVHVPRYSTQGTWTYRVTKRHMGPDGKLFDGTQLVLSIELDMTTYRDFLDVGFTRGFASSQAFLDRVPEGQNVDTYGKSLIPANADAGPTFPKPTFDNPYDDVYRWMGFEAHYLLFSFLKEVKDDPTVTVDFFAYDLNEPDIVAGLAELGDRLRAVIDNSTGKDDDGNVVGHGLPDSAESRSSVILEAAGAKVHRTHFSRLQHNKLFVARRGEVPFKVLTGSMNFSFRGLYIQSNNVLVFSDPAIAKLYGDYFDAAFSDPTTLRSNLLTQKWHRVQSGTNPAIEFCFSPHTDPNIGIDRVGKAITNARSSVLYNVAFLNLLESGPTFDAFKALLDRNIFSYGVSDEKGKLQIKKPNGEIGLVDFAYLSEKAPQPFKREWSGQKGRNVHNKFVVTDFNKTAATVFTGSSNLSPGGEGSNGDNLIMIRDPRVATAYAIEALLVFDHLQFRNRMEDASKKLSKQEKLVALTLRKPTVFSGQPAWFEEYYVKGSQRAADRKLFST